ncbi:MAG: FAD:protein FMN transferase, partial [Thermoanaerobaculales bacterium]
MISRSTEPRSRRRLPLEVVVAIILVAVAVAVAVAGAGEPGERMVERRVFTMGSVLEMVVWAADRKTALEASQAAVAAIDAAELRLSTWRSDSELARLNDSPPGVWEPLSAELASDLQSSLDWWRATGGAFDPGVGSLVRAWDLRGRGKVPEPAEILKAHAASGAGRLEIAEGRARRSLPGLILEEGGFGKGVALRDGASAARAAGA